MMFLTLWLLFVGWCLPILLPVFYCTWFSVLNVLGTGSYRKSHVYQLAEVQTVHYEPIRPIVHQHSTMLIRNVRMRYLRYFSLPQCGGRYFPIGFWNVSSGFLWQTSGQLWREWNVYTTSPVVEEPIRRPFNVLIALISTILSTMRTSPPRRSSDPRDCQTSCSI